MCHPVSGDTCHLDIGPTACQKCQISMTRVASWRRHMSCTESATSLYRIYHITVRNLPRHCTESATCHCTDVPRVLPSQHQIFACLTFRTERDIFSIRTPFDIKIIPPESGRRDERNGTGFIAFRALSFLSIFQALSGFWICFQIRQSV
jgi:hypothetical protein